MRHLDGMQKLTRTAFIATIALVIITATVWGIRLFAMSRNQTVTQSTNPANYPIGGFALAACGRVSAFYAGNDGKDARGSVSTSEPAPRRWSTARRASS